MKLYSKLSALGAVFVLTTAFASADVVIPFASGSGSVTYLGYSTTLGGAPVIQAGGVNNTPTTGCFVTSCITYSVSPGTIWAPALPGSTWVSYDPNSGPTGGQNGGSIPYDANGFYTYMTNFNLPTSSFGEITVAADDTVALFVDGVEISPEASLGGDGMCADGTPNCRAGGTTTVTFGLPAGFQVLDLVVEQSGSIYQGLDYTGTITETPEPNTLLLLGTGLLGSAGALFRKMRAA